MGRMQTLRHRRTDSGASGLRHLATKRSTTTTAVLCAWRRGSYQMLSITRISLQSALALAGSTGSVQATSSPTQALFRFSLAAAARSQVGGLRHMEFPNIDFLCPVFF